jgi:signal transduction histidine kinase
MTITTARSDGQMQLEFVAGLQATEDEIGGIVVSVAGNPDGLVNPRDYGLHSQMTVPISAIDGTITIRSRQRYAYGPECVDIMRQVVAQISPGIANAIHYQDSQHQVMERTALAEIGRAATQEIDLDSILLVVSGTLSNLMKFDHLGTILTNTKGESATVVCWSSEGLLGINVGDTVDLRAAGNMSGVITGRGKDPLGLSPQVGKPGGEERIWMQVPLGEQANLLGVIVVSAPIDAVLGEDEADLLQRVANQIAPAIKNARLTADLKKAVTERQAIAVVGRAASTEFEMNRIFAVVAEELDDVVPYDWFVAMIAEPDTEYLEVVYVKGTPLSGSAVGDRIPDFTAEEKQELKAGRAILRSRVDESTSTGPAGDTSAVGSWVQVALGDLNDPMGYISLRSQNPDAHDMSHVEFLEGIARQITPTLKNARLFEQERALRDRLDSQNRDLHEANAAKTRFLSTISHELKTPLTIISGFVDLMSDSVDQFDAEHAESLDIIRKNAARLGLLINDVLDISRIDAGKLRIEPTVFQLNELLGELEKGFEQILETKNHTLVVSMPDDVSWLEADRNRIAQLISNLINNAHKYSGPDCEIRLSTAIEDESLTVIIEDDGIGISEGDQKQLFTAFFRADNEATREAGGTGLGLVIAKSIVDLHDGAMWLNSIENQGTTVGFKLPCVTSEPIEVTPDDAELSLLSQRSRLFPDTEWDQIAETA